MKITTSAPGKLILLGEHAVVYGYPCIVTTLDKRILVSAELSENRKDTIIKGKVADTTFVRESVSFFKKKYRIKKKVTIETKTDFSDQLGFGSSAAVTVATVHALNLLFAKKMSKKQLFNMCYKICLEVQGTGSGFDVAASVFGNTLYYSNKGKIIEQINDGKLRIIVGYSGVKAKTTKLVQQVAKLYRSDKQHFVGIFNEITKIVNKGRKMLETKDYVVFGRLMTKNHELLKILGVSTIKLDAMVKAALDSGAYGAKLSGAGGGDCMIALVDKNNHKHIETAIMKAGGEVIKVNFSQQGVRKDI